jgi:hypothetical protein
VIKIVLKSYEFFKSQGKWSEYLTIKKAFSGEYGQFLGSVEYLTDLPISVAAAMEIWELLDPPSVTDTAFVNSDSDHNDSPSQYTISDISDDGALTWKYQFTIPIPDSGKPTDIISDDFNIGYQTIPEDPYKRTINIKSGGLVTDQLAYAAVTPEKIEGGDINTVLKTDETGTVVWGLTSNSNDYVTSAELSKIFGEEIVIDLDTITPVLPLISVGDVVIDSDYTSAKVTLVDGTNVTVKTINVPSENLQSITSDDLSLVVGDNIDNNIDLGVRVSSKTNNLLKLIDDDPDTNGLFVDNKAEPDDQTIYWNEEYHFLSVKHYDEEEKKFGIDETRIQDEAVSTRKIMPSYVVGQVLKTLRNEDDAFYVDWVNEYVPSVDDVTIHYNDSDELEVKDSGISEVKLADDSVTTVKIVDGNVTTSKLDDESVTEAKIADNNVTTSKLEDRSVTLPKIAVGDNSQILRTVYNESTEELETEWSDEVDISNKADKFNYTPVSGSETLYNLEDIQTFSVAGNGQEPNTGITFTNFAGEETVIDIDQGSGYFNYKGQVATYEDLPALDDPDLSNGDLYSIYGPINYIGSVPAMEDLPDDPADLDQYYVEDENNYQYWHADSTEPDGGMWIINHCQLNTDGCDNTGYYAFGVGESNAHWNRLDSDLTIDQALDVNSVNAIANKAVTGALITKLNILSPNTLSEFFNGNDGAGFSYKDDSARELAGVTVNYDVPQLYLNRYNEIGDLTNKVLFEIHDDGAYISTSLGSPSWTRIATMSDVNNLIQDYTVDKLYNSNIILRYHETDDTGSSYNRFGVSNIQFDTDTFVNNVDNGIIDELTNNRELISTLTYCVENYFPTPLPPEEDEVV